MFGMSQEKNGGERNGLLSAAAIIALSGLASRVLGLVRDRLFADRFGAGEVLDAYFAAYRIPDLVYNLLILGALSAAFLPIVSEYLSRGSAGRAMAFRMANALLTIAVLALAVIAAVLFLFTPTLISFLAPGFDDARRDLTITFTRIMLLQPILLGVSSIMSGILLAFHRFVAYAAAPVLYNAGIILGVLVFVPMLGVAGLAWGVVLGALLHVLVQIPAVFAVGFRFRPEVRLDHPGVRHVSHLFVPRLIGLIAQQGAVVIVTLFGSGLLAGGIAAYMLAENMSAVPIGLVGISVAVAAFPFLAGAAARQDLAAFSETLGRAIRVVFFVSLPASIFLLLLRAQVVRVVLGTGAFDWDDTVATFTVLGILSFSIVAQSLIPLLARAFFSLHDTRTPMLVSLAGIGVNLAGAFVLAPRYGVVGLAWAFTAASLLHFVLLLAQLHVRLGGLQDDVLLVSVFRTGVAAIVAAVAVQGPAALLSRMGMNVPTSLEGVSVLLYGLKGVIASVVDMQTFVGVATQLFGSLLGGAAVFLFVVHFLGAEEPALVFRALRRPRRLGPAHVLVTED